METNTCNSLMTPEEFEKHLKASKYAYESIKNTKCSIHFTRIKTVRKGYNSILIGYIEHYPDRDVHYAVTSSGWAQTFKPDKPG